MQSTYEYCSKCQSAQNMVVTESKRNEIDDNGDAQVIVTHNFHCESCQAFIRSEENQEDLEA